MGETLTPGDETSVADAVAGLRSPVRVEGGGTRSSGQTPDLDVLSLRNVSGITLYEPGALTVVARSGTPLTEIEAALDAEGQILPFEPFTLNGVTGAEGVSTIGGIVATNASGARRVSAGACRDYLLGVRFVDGAGTVVKNGGRVMKNVTGYDLTKLMAGARGTLGVLTEVAFKVLPKPEATATLTVEGLSDEDAVALMARAMGSPFEVSGAIHVSGGATRLRVEGFVDSVRYRAGRLRDDVFANVEVSIVDGAEAWDTFRELSGFGSSDALWSLSLKPTDAPVAVGEVKRRHDPRIVYDWAGGRVWIGATEGDDVAGLHHSLRETAARFGGHATLHHGPAALADVVSVIQPETEPLRKLADGLRRKFDPRGLLNPGLMDT